MSSTPETTTSRAAGARALPGRSRSAPGGRARLTLVALAAASAACAGDHEVEQPAPLYGDVPIEYPLSLWDQGIEGETLLRVRVTDVGEVDSVVVLETSGHPAFDSAAIAGARELRFRPARKKGKRIEVWAQVPVHFSRKPRPTTPGGG